MHSATNEYSDKLQSLTPAPAIEANNDGRPTVFASNADSYITGFHSFFIHTGDYSSARDNFGKAVWHH